MSVVPTRETPVPDPDLLEPLLRALVDEHERLLVVTLEHREAIAQADADRLAQALAELGAVMQRISELDDQRRALLGDAEATTLDAIASRLEQPQRGRVEQLGAGLRDLIDRVRREQARVIREATRTLASHMDGLIRQVAARLSHTGTYGSAGRIENGAPVVSGLDLTR